MFDISWSELLILGVVTLIFVGPKELPVFLRTIGRYAGMVKRQAAEFRTQFDEAMRDAELDQMRKEFEKTRDDVNKSIMDAERDMQKEFDDAKRDLDEVQREASDVKAQAQAPEEHHDADGLPMKTPDAPAASSATSTPSAAPRAAEPAAAIAATPGNTVISGAPGSGYVAVPPFGKGV